MPPLTITSDPIVMFPALLTRVQVKLPLSSLVADFINSWPALALETIRPLAISCARSGLPIFSPVLHGGKNPRRLEATLQGDHVLRVGCLLGRRSIQFWGLHVTFEKEKKVKHSTTVYSAGQTPDSNIASLGNFSLNVFYHSVPS